MVKKKINMKKIIKHLEEQKKLLRNPNIMGVKTFVGSKTVVWVRVISATSFLMDRKKPQQKKTYVDPIDECIDPPHLFDGEPAVKLIPLDDSGKRFFDISEKATIQ
jgi:hypothetical protein